MVQTPRSVLALDVGEARVGVALASLIARLPQPLATLKRGEGFWSDLQKIIEEEAVGELVVGLPRNLSGQNTAQTATVQAFAEELKQKVNLPIHFQDEAVTSQQAEAELEGRHKPYSKGDIDALAATYILEDYLSQV